MIRMSHKEPNDRKQFAERVQSNGSRRGRIRRHVRADFVHNQGTRVVIIINSGSTETKLEVENRKNLRNLYFNSGKKKYKMDLGSKSFGDFTKSIVSHRL